MKSFTILVVIFFAFLLHPQTKDPDAILERVKKEFEKIDDYQVDIKIKIDVDFLKMPDREATIYYKKPDKFYIDSENFTMLPKSGMNFSPLSFLNYKYSSFYVKEDTINGRQADEIKVIPLEGNADVIISTLWIDTQRNIILKVESSKKPQGTFTIDLEYLKTNEGFWLPSSLVFVFTIEGSLYQAMSRESIQKELKSADKPDEQKTGKVYLTYSNYKVNIGLPDSIFEKKDSEK
jgi:outer membrane lipoprotein-sorting protein